MRTLLLSFLLCVGLWYSPGADADEIVGSTPQDELGQCRTNLHLIHEAILAYRRASKALPNELTELPPRFLSQVHLICPTARRLGLTSIDFVGWGPPGPITYTYEFTSSSIPPVISGGDPRSMREWKELQMGLIGSDVPIVRCHIHERAALNLAFSGRIYETTGIDWEDSFSDVVAKDDLTFVRRFAAYTRTKKIVVPTRDAQAPATLVDLSNHYNSSLDDALPGSEHLRPLSSLASGIVQLKETRFDVRGAIQLRALRPGLILYPSAVTNLIVGLPGTAVQLLVGTVASVAPQTRVAACVFHLRHGGRQELELHYGTHLAACVARSDEALELQTEVKPAWSKRLADGGVARLYLCHWTNPSPLETIESVDFLARDKFAGPFLVALSIEPNR